MVRKNIEEENATDSERGKKDTACAILSEKHDAWSQSEENLKTFSRQKLALLQCGYDPKICGFCEKAFPSDVLKQCTRCKTAKYCSKRMSNKGLGTKTQKSLQRNKEATENRKQFKSQPHRRFTQLSKS